MIKDNKIIRTKDYSDITLKQSARHCFVLKKIYLETNPDRIHVKYILSDDVFNKQFLSNILFRQKRSTHRAINLRVSKLSFKIPF